MKGSLFYMFPKLVQINYIFSGNVKKRYRKPEIEEGQTTQLTKEEGQTTQLPKENRQKENNDIQNAHTVSKISSNTNPTENRRLTQVPQKGIQFLDI